MEYPFKDLLPLDEVLAREGYYKDWTHLDPEVFYSLTQISNFIKTKGYGVDVRLLIAQLAEHFGLKTTQVVDLANLLQQKFTNLEGVTQSFTNNINSLVAQMEVDKDAVIANATVDSEVILARGGKATLGQRLDDTTAQLAQTGLNVKSLGASGVGVETNIFQEAIDYAKDQDLNLFIPQGQFEVGTIYVKGNIKGLGKNTKLKAHYLYINNEENIVIEDVHFIFENTNMNGIKINDSKNITFKNCIFESFYDGEWSSQHISFTNTDNAVFTNNKTIGCNVIFSNCNNIKVLENTIDGAFRNGGDLVKCTAKTSGLIHGNTILNSDLDGIDTYSSGERMVITNNHIENIFTNGIEAKVVLRDPLGEGDPYDGGSSDRNNSFAESCVIINNIFKNVGGASGDNYGAIKNTFVDLRTDKIKDVAKEPRTFIITNNIIEDINKNKDGNGIYSGIISGANNTIIANNIIRNVYKGVSSVENSGSGIYLDTGSSDVLVKGNIIAGAESVGIRGFHNERLTIHANSITNDKVSGMTSVYGIRVASASSSVVSDNNINNTSGSSIFITNGATNSMFTNNIVENSININQKIERVTFDGNHVTGTVIVGSVGYGSTSATFTNNKVKNTGNSPGVRFYEVEGGIISGNVFEDISYGGLIDGESTYIMARNNLTKNQTNYTSEGIRFLNVSEENQLTSVIESNMVF